jgi:hypothetical protein
MNEGAENTDRLVISCEDEIPKFGCGSEAIDAEILL